MTVRSGRSSTRVDPGGERTRGTGYGDPPSFFSPSTSLSSSHVHKNAPSEQWWAIDARKKTSPLYNSCLALEQEVMSKGTTFLMNENWLPGGSSALPQNRRRRLTASSAPAHATTLPSAPSSADAAATHRLRHARLRRQRSVAGSFDGLSASAKTQVAAPALPLTPSLRSSLASAMPPPVTLCSQFMNVILVREPTARIVSHRNYMHALGAAGGKTPMPLGTMSEFVEVAPIVTNNFYIRILNGEVSLE